MSTTRLHTLTEQLAQRRHALAVSILDVADAALRHELAARLAALVEAEGAIAREAGRDSWLKASDAYGVNRVTALLDFERAAVTR